MKMFNDGDVHIGEYQFDTRHGRGVYQYANGDEFDGTWQDGRQSGSGIYRYASSGAAYEGKWQNGEMHGSGYYATSDQQVYLEVWEEGNRTLRRRLTDQQAQERPRIEL